MIRLEVLHLPGDAFALVLSGRGAVDYFSGDPAHRALATIKDQVGAKAILVSDEEIEIV